MRVSREEFEALVERAVDDLPEEFQQAIDNVMVMVEEEPDDERREAHVPPTGGSSPTHRG